MKKSLLLIAFGAYTYHGMAQSHASSDKPQHYFGTEELSRVSKEALEIDAVADILLPFEFKILGQEIKPFAFVQVPLEFPIKEEKWWKPEIPWVAAVVGGEHSFPLLGGKGSISAGVGMESYFDTLGTEYSLRCQISGSLSKGPVTLTIMSGIGKQAVISGMISYQFNKFKNNQFIKHVTIGLRCSNQYGTGPMVGYTWKRFTLFGGVLNSFDHKDSPWTPAFMFRTNLN